MGELPADVLLHLFKRMDTLSAARLARAARIFKRVFNDPVLWKNYFVRDFGVEVPLGCEPQKLYKMFFSSPEHVVLWKKYFTDTVKSELDRIQMLSTHDKTPEDLFGIFYRLIDCKRFPEYQIDVALAACTAAYLSGLSVGNCTKLLTTSVNDEHSTKRSEPLDSYPALNGLNLRWMRATEEDKQRRSCAQFVADRKYQITQQIMLAKQQPLPLVQKWR